MHGLWSRLLVCGNDQNNTLYRNEAGTLSTAAAWSAGPDDWTFAIALGDLDGDGDLDLACGNLRRNTLYRNDGGVFADSSAWSSDSTNWTRAVALGDVDGDGDLDLTCGNLTNVRNVTKRSFARLVTGRSPLSC